MNVGHAGGKEPVTRCGKGHAGAGHRGSVEAHEDAQSHGSRDQRCAPMSGNDRHSEDRGARGVRDPDRGQNVLNGRVGGHVEDADDAHAGYERNGQAALRPLHLAGDHGEVVPAVVSP